MYKIGCRGCGNNFVNRASVRGRGNKHILNAGGVEPGARCSVPPALRGHR